MSHNVVRSWWAGLFLLAGCGNGPNPTPCAEEFATPTAAGGCAGVEQARLCSDTYCVPEDAACTGLLYVQAGAKSGDGSEARPFADLPAAAAEAASGTCIVVAAGDYTGAELPGGVSLLGAGAALVSIEGGDGVGTLTLAAGEGARIRGVRLRGPDRGLDVRGAIGLVVEQVAVTEAADAGITLFSGSEAELRGVLVRGITAAPAGHGVYATGGGRLGVTSSLVESNAGAGIGAVGTVLQIESSVVRSNGGYGVAAEQVVAGCELRSTTVEDNGTVGVFVSGSTCTISATEVAGTRFVSGLALLVSVQDGADVEILEDSRLRDSEGLGVLVDGSRLRMVGGECSGNEDRGIWLQGIDAAQLIDGQAVLLDGVAVQDNGFVGVGGTESAGIVIVQGIVGGTVLRSIASGPSVIQAGDGLQALAGSDLRATDVTLEANERAAALFDDSTGSVSNCVVGTAGEDGLGLVAQNGVAVDQFIGNTDASGNPVGVDQPTTPLDHAPDRLGTASALTAVDP